MATLALQQVRKAFGPVEVVHGVVEPLGSETLVTLDVGGIPLHAHIPPRSVRAAGQPVRLRFDPAQLHLFARDDAGARL